MNATTPPALTRWIEARSSSLVLAKDLLQQVGDLVRGVGADLLLLLLHDLEDALQGASQGPVLEVEAVQQVADERQRRSLLDQLLVRARDRVGLHGLAVCVCAS